jgi:hypothetical protein
MKRRVLGGLLMTSLSLTVLLGLMAAAPVWSAQDDSTPTPMADGALPEATPTVADLQSGDASLQAGDAAQSGDAIVRKRVRLPLLPKAPTPTPTPTVAPAEVGKRSLSGVTNCNQLAMLGLKKAAYFVWDSNPPVCAGYTPIPMIWGAGKRPATITNSPYLLLFNECDRSDQCNASPETMAQEWRYWEGRFPNRKLIGPNISGDGWTWLQQWHDAYVRLYGQNPRMYALGYHCYGIYDECQRRIAQAVEVAKAWTTSGKVWVTEWGILACMKDAAYSLSEGNRLRAYMDAEPRVETYMWFTTEFLWGEDPPNGFGKACNTPLIRSGALTQWGTWYKQ